MDETPHPAPLDAQDDSDWETYEGLCKAAPMLTWPALQQLHSAGLRVVRCDLAHGTELVHVGVLIDGEFYPTELLAGHMPFATPPGTLIRPVYTTQENL